MTAVGVPSRLAVAGDILTIPPTIGRPHGLKEFRRWAERGKWLVASPELAPVRRTHEEAEFSDDVCAAPSQRTDCTDCTDCNSCVCAYLSSAM